MKRILVAAALAVGLGGAAAADPIEGIWQTEVDDGAYAHVQIKPCGDAYCGTFIRTFNADGEYKSANLGKQVVRSMKPTGGGKYEGKVWRPSNNKVYLGKATVQGKAMALSGCVAGGLFCAKQNWVKIK